VDCTAREAIAEYASDCVAFLDAAEGFEECTDDDDDDNDDRYLEQAIEEYDSDCNTAARASVEAIEEYLADCASVKATE
jgi:hypothetical protein